MLITDIPHQLSGQVNDLAIAPLKQFFAALNDQNTTVLYVLLAIAVTVGFMLGRRRGSHNRNGRPFRSWTSPQFQNDGESLVTRLLMTHCHPPHYHLLNHVTLRMDDGTTQVDHILVSRFGVFVIETKDYGGWIFANASSPTWTHVFYQKKYKFQNPLLQNYRHVRAVQDLLDFLPPEAVKSVVVFTGDGEFKTAMPDGVIQVDQLGEYLHHQSTEVMSLRELQFCVGRLETARLAITGQTDVEHVQSLARRHGTAERSHH